VKHLLILISLILLSSPVIINAKKGETLYKWETSSGIHWREYGDKDIHAKYKGEVEKRKPHGLGLIKFPDGTKYMGEWFYGKYHGQGTYISPNGEKYVGGWSKNFKHGQGKSSLGNKLIYEGEWNYGGLRNGAHYDKEGKIIVKYVNGKIDDKDKKNKRVLYLGLRNGKSGFFTEKWEGLGDEKNIDYAKYEGDVDNGLPNGQGEETSIYGRTYVGGFKDGKEHGIGKYTHTNDEIFVGEWKDGEMWNGKFYDQNGYLIGNFVNGKNKR
jgi:hypothetical protein